MSQAEARGTVHFSSIPDIVEIPRRSVWQRKWKPMKDKCCSVCCAMVYVFCFPCANFLRHCCIWCRPIKEDESNHSANLPNTRDRRNSHNSYPRVEASQSLTNVPYTSNSTAVIKPPPPQLM